VLITALSAPPLAAPAVQKSPSTPLLSGGLRSQSDQDVAKGMLLLLYKKPDNALMHLPFLSEMGAVS
jgi:hypothetical protein